MKILIIYGLLIVGSMVGYFYLRKKWKYKNYLLLLAVLGVFCFGIAMIDLMSQEHLLPERLERNEAGEGSTQLQVLLEAEDFFEEDYVVTVEEQKLTEEDANQILEGAKAELENTILGNNLSLQEIKENLQVPYDLGNGLVSVTCTFDPYTLIAADGTILWENMNENVELVKVTAAMSCQEQEVIHEFYVQLLPKKLEEKELLLKKIEDCIQEQNESEGEDYLHLPQEINGRILKWHYAKEPLHLKALFLGMAVMVCVYVSKKEKQEKEEKQRKKLLLLDYPEIVSQLSLLSGAGMTVSAAWGKIAWEYKRKKEKKNMAVRPGYEEVLKTWYEMQDGVSEMKAYENFGKRCALSQYRKFSSLLIQNVRKGTRGMQQLLDLEASEAFTERKLYAKRLGEEAGTKLLIPMGIILVLVFAILMLPAMIALN